MKKTYTHLDLSEMVGIAEIIGKPVIAKNGEEIGIIKDIKLDSEIKTIKGILMEKGNFESDVFIGRDYVDQLDDSGARLIMTPLEEFVGRDVLDCNGNIVGKVKKVNRSGTTNKLISLIVEDKGGKEIEAHKFTIDSLGENINLTLSEEECQKIKEKEDG